MTDSNLSGLLSTQLIPPSSAKRDEFLLACELSLWTLCEALGFFDFLVGIQMVSITTVSNTVVSASEIRIAHIRPE
jgi:hypothetical protein